MDCELYLLKTEVAVKETELFKWELLLLYLLLKHKLQVICEESKIRNILIHLII